MTGYPHLVADGLGGILVAFFATLGALVILNRLAPLLELVDRHDGGRRRRGAPVPLTGGLAILCGL